MTKLLIEGGAEISATDDCGRSALHWATGGGLTYYGPQYGATRDWLKQVRGLRVEVVKHLLDKGAEIGAKDRLGRTAYDYAVKAQFWELEKLLAC